MNNYPSFAIVLSFLGLWLTSFFSMDFQVIIGFVLILTFGILHGANDILIMKHLFLKKNNFTFSKLLFYYIVTILACGLLFYLIPWLVLLLFILVSGYHFGEQQLEHIKDEFKNYNFVFKMLYGLLVLFLLFNFHIKEVIAVVYEITSFKVDDILIEYSLYFILILFAINYILLFLKSKKNKNILLKELFYLMVYAIIFKVSSLIWGFAIYFIVWHSIPSIINQTKFLYGSFNYIHFMTYLKGAFFYWIVSLMGLFLFYFLFQDIKLFNTMFFSFLAAITFPHVLVIVNMFNKK